ncbi:MAG: hypothetical protein PHV07_02980 [Oscillospiraceae bacterium]|nr:hypothetical protein [Oscillospiraceae bacterium]
MKVPIFADAIEDSSLSELLNEVKSENNYKSFDQARERVIPEGFDKEMIAEEEKTESLPEKVEEKPLVKKPFMPYNEQAEMLVTALDSVQQLSLPALAKKMSFTTEEKRELKRIRRKRKIDKNDLTGEEKLLFEKWVMIKDFEEELPFTQKEIKFLSDPLARMLEQSQAEMKPGMALMVAAATVSLPRVAMLFALKSDLSELEVKPVKKIEDGKQNNTDSGAAK